MHFEPPLTTPFQLSQIVLDRLVKLDSLREINLSVYVSFGGMHDRGPEKSKVEHNFQEVLKCFIYFNWLQFPSFDEFVRMTLD